MYQQLRTYLDKWNEVADERHKLQHTYAFGGVAMLVIAGIIGLVNYSLGQGLMVIGLLAIAIYFINGIVWALLTAFVLLRLDSHQAEKEAIKPRTKKR